MKKIVILITLLMLGGQAATNCTYKGNTKRQGLTLTNIKIPTDASIPVGSVLHTHKFGTGAYKTFTCNKNTDDQYIIDVGAAVVLVLPVFRVVRFMKRGLMGLGFRSPICYVVKWFIDRRRGRFNLGTNNKLI